MESNGRKKTAQSLIDALTAHSKSLSRLSDKLMQYVIGNSPVDVDVTVKQEQQVEQPRRSSNAILAIAMLVMMAIAITVVALQVKQRQVDQLQRPVPQLPDK